MKNLIVGILCLISTLSFSQYQTDHVFEPSIGTYIDWVTIYPQGDEYEGRNTYPGLEFNVRHSLEGINYVGTDFGVLYDWDLKMPVAYLGITLRHQMFNNLFEPRLILPRIHMPFDAGKPIGYNAPFGVELRIFKGKVRTKITSYFFKNAAINRVTIFYRL